MRASMKQVVAALKCKKAPQQIWQRAFDDDSQHLSTLLQYAPYVPGSGVLPHPANLVDYSYDLQYEDIQPDLFRCLLPLCLETWSQNLFASVEATRYQIFVEHFITAAIACPFLQDQLDEQEYRTVATFMQDSILDRLDQEKLVVLGAKNATYVWFRALGTFAVIFPLLEQLWEEWWSMKTPGHAVAVLQYIACLMYLEDENPIFTPRTFQRGGGPPELWGTEAMVDQKGWREENVSFVRSTLTINYVEHKLKQAAALVQGLGDTTIADRMMQDFKTHRDILTYHIEMLPDLLASSQLTDGEKLRVWE